MIKKFVAYFGGILSVMILVVGIWRLYSDLLTGRYGIFAFLAKGLFGLENNPYMPNYICYPGYAGKGCTLLYTFSTPVLGPLFVLILGVIFLISTINYYKKI